MRILTRHLIKAHLGPFLFALSALTGLLFLNAVALRMEDLAGKGLTWNVIGEFLLLSLPHTIALTLPMAVLVAVLYAFSEMTASNEITAMKAGGIPPHRLLVPLLLTGTLIGGVMLFFNDQVLPEANHRLKNLMLDINRKSPTFVLREQVMNRVQTGETGKTYFIKASRIDNQRNRLEDVVIVDGSDPARRRTTYADSGFMAFNAERTDLYLTLFHGKSLELDPERPGGFRVAFFERQAVPLRGVGNELNRRMDAADRGDREMTLAMLRGRAGEARDNLRLLKEQSRDRNVDLVRIALGQQPTDSTLADLDRSGAPTRRPSPSQGNALTRDPVTQRASVNAATYATRAVAFRQSANRYEVELHKKYTLAFACIVFVLLGVPLAIRFPRGGLGMVIAASSTIFAVYWVGLIGGEKLADRGFAPPAITMWIPNIIFTLLGLLLVRNMGKEAATTRGGGWDDLWWVTKGLVGRLFGRGRPALPEGGDAAESAA